MLESILQCLRILKFHLDNFLNEYMHCVKRYNIIADKILGRPVLNSRLVRYLGAILD